MSKRITGADIAAAAAVLLGVIAAFIPWYSYTTATVHVSVDAFRASLLGVIFFLAIGGVALILLARRGIIDDALTHRLDESRTLAALALVAGATVVVQLVLNATTHGRTLGLGMVFAVFAALLTELASWYSGRPEEGRQRVRQMVEEDALD